MIRFQNVLLATVAMVGCATVDEKVDAYGRVQRITSMTSLSPGDARAYAQTAAFADSSKALAASGSGGFASHCEANGPCTQVSVMPNWAAGNMVGPYAGAGQWSQGQAFFDAVESAPAVSGTSTSDPALAEKVNVLGKRVEGLEGVVVEVKGDVRALGAMHAPEEGAK